MSLHGTRLHSLKDKYAAMAEAEAAKKAEELEKVEETAKAKKLKAKKQK